MHFSWRRQKRKPSALWAPGAGDTPGACTYKSHQPLVEECADGNNFLTALPAFGTEHEDCWQLEVGWYAWKYSEHGEMQGTLTMATNIHV